MARAHDAEGVDPRARAEGGDSPARADDDTAASALLPWLRAPLAQALRDVRGHATLIAGTAGVGQHEFARALARGWLCEAERRDPGPGADDEGAFRPCGVCASCRLVAAGSHPDLLELLPEALRIELGEADAAGGMTGDDAPARKSRPSRDIRVEAVRNAIDWCQRSSGRGRAKVLLLYPAEAMNMVAANALLKTLEEPPGLLRVLLATQAPGLLLPTLRSRCQWLALPMPPAPQALAWLAGQGIAEPELLLRAAGGQPLAARAMARCGIDAAGWLALPKLVRQGRAGDHAGGLAAWGVPAAVDALTRLCHDLMALAVGAAPRFFDAAALPPGAALAPLLAWSRALADAARHDEHPWNAALLLEALVGQGAACWPAAAPRASGRGGGSGSGGAASRRIDTLPQR